MEPSEVQKFYKDAGIFITGGSGFLGMLLIQKLIRDCPDISKIYVLLRHKKGTNADERFEEMFQDIIFAKMKTDVPNYRKKIRLIMGDLQEPGLAINEEDKNLILKDVNMIFHLAATLRFDEKVKKAAEINVRATKDIIALAKSIRNLKVYLHCSTVYSFSVRQTVSEKMYDSHITPQRLLQITDTLTDEELEILTPKLLGQHVNTYTFTKCLAEKLIEEQAADLPVVMFRPSMVISTVSDPVEGWINNYYGPVGIALGAGAGIIRVVYVNPDIKCDIVPADYVINNMIVAAQYVGTAFNRKNDQNAISDKIKTSNGLTIFNCVSCQENPITYGQFRDFGYEATMKWQSSRCFWYYVLYMVQNYYLYIFLQLMLHDIPSYIGDFILQYKGKKPLLVKINRRIKNLNAISTYYTETDFKFENDNTQALWKMLNNTDKKLFEFCMKSYNWKTYITENFGKGSRLYMYREPLETLPMSRRRYMKLTIAHYTLKTILYLIMVYFVYTIFGMIL